MPKHIVLCADGTWDGADEKSDSNVLKLFDALSGSLTMGKPTDPEQEKQTAGSDGATQVSKYIHGVGNSQNRLKKLLGGGLGTGLVGRILRGYTFISRNYVTGDAIVIVGFSRGAYTARALADFICKTGLLDYSALHLESSKPDNAAYPYAAAAWHAYQKQRDASQSRHWLAKVEDFAAALDSVLPFQTLAPIYRKEVVEIAAVGVWDTVGALGIPELSADHGTRLDLLRFVDAKLPKNVKQGFQAVAADEHRIDFSPSLWDPEPPRVLQCLFPGAHADVGGGYPEGPESLLSDGALSWMAEKLTGCGVQFARDLRTPPRNFHLGPMHMPWTSSVWQARPTGPREFPEYLGPDNPLGCHDGLKRRAGKIVPEYTDTTPRMTHHIPYVPASLVNAGYLNVSGVKVRP